MYTTAEPQVLLASSKTAFVDARASDVFESSATSSFGNRPYFRKWSRKLLTQRRSSSGRLQVGIANQAIRGGFSGRRSKAGRAINSELESIKPLAAQARRSSRTPAASTLPDGKLLATRSACASKVANWEHAASSLVDRFHNNVAIQRIVV